MVQADAIVVENVEGDPRQPSAPQFVPREDALNATYAAVIAAAKRVKEQIEGDDRSGQDSRVTTALGVLERAADLLEALQKD